VLLGEWGTDGGLTGADLNGSGVVTGADLAMVLEQWGQACPPITTPPWATILERYPDPAIVPSVAMRFAITSSGRPWRVRDNATQIEMVLVPSGTYQRGCSASNAYSCYANEFPLHQVTLTNAFYIGRLEVTKPQWQAVMGYLPTTGWICHPPSYCANWPVSAVGWSEVQGFLVRSGMRLPTEAEWEWAYRAGTTTAFHGWPGAAAGSDSELSANVIAFRQPLGSSGGWAPGDGGQRSPNGFGLFDMAGNFAEFVDGWYGIYPDTPVSNPTGPSSGTLRIVRGGSYQQAWPAALRSSSREPVLGGSESWIGFRVARNP
jgi:formylglycine-generating enzyme required for sulfatase activity